MTSLDLRTIILMSGGMAALMALVLAFMHHTYPKSIRGLGTWSVGLLLIFSSTVLFGARDVLPELLTVVVANLLLLGGSGLLTVGSSRFFNHAAPRWGVPLLLLACTPGLLWWTLVQPDYPMRLLFISTVMLVLQLWHLGITWRYDRHSWAARFTITILTLIVLSLGLRVVSIALGTGGDNFFSPTLVQTLYLGSYSFGLLLLTISLVLQAAQRLHQELEQLVSHDMLTGALTRRALFEQGEIEIERSQRSARPMSVLMLDLDHFKRINDEHGHLVGDRVLRDFAERVQAQLRRPDQFGRFGGEEFLALLPDTDHDQALTVAERIRASTPTDPTLPVCTVSIGVATRPVRHPESLEALISRADQALYRAKDLGRDRVEMAPPPV